jgi:7,8-dihydropterin-6-yl-methyl-4-(beta-D-ribofuranosyl)aminobenzene 5'-phosphate synthase
MKSGGENIMKVTTLVENTLADESLQAQHGISLFIEYNGKTILFDTGSSDLFLRNSQKINASISNVDYVIISHAHYDHGGGLKALFSINSKAEVFLSDKADTACYAKPLPMLYKYIGLKKEILDKYKERITFVEKTLSPMQGITLLTNSCDTYPRPTGNRKLFVKKGGKYSPDTFEHELITVFENRDGSITILTGCSHNGLLNMISSAEAAFPGKKIKGIIGGFHLMNPITKKLTEKKETVEEIADNIASKNIDQIYTGHCTGDGAFNILQSKLGDRLKKFQTGAVLEI